MDEYLIEQVWPEPDKTTRQQVIAFWRAETDLAAGKLLERSSQLVCVCRTSTGNVAAVSTAVRYGVASLGFDCFFVRVLVGRQHRARIAKHFRN